MNISKIFWIALASLLACTLSAATIVDGVSDLTWVDSNGASSSVAGEVLTIDTAKNSEVTALLGSTYALTGTGDQLLVQFDFTFDNAVSSGDRMYIAFRGNSGATVSRAGIDLDGDGILEDEISTNLGKWNDAAGAPGTTTYTFSYIIEKAAADLDFTATSSLISGGTFNRPSSAGVATSFDRVAFEFSGNTFRDNDINVDIENFSIQYVPEPSSFALLGLALGGLALMRRRK